MEVILAVVGFLKNCGIYENSYEVLVTRFTNVLEQIKYCRSLSCFVLIFQFLPPIFYNVIILGKVWGYTWLLFTEN